MPQPAKTLAIKEASHLTSGPRTHVADGETDSVHCPLDSVGANIHTTYTQKDK